jgi:hypothetical protein
MVCPNSKALTNLRTMRSLVRSGTDRPYPRQLLSHPYIVTSESKKVNMAKWVTTLCGMPPG